MNFNGKITEWEASFVKATGGLKVYGDTIIKLLVDIRNAVSDDGPEKKIVTRRGTANTYATGADNFGANTYATLIEIPHGQEYTIVHVGCNDALGVIRLSLDGRVVGSFQQSRQVKIRIGAGNLQVTSSVDGMDYMVQMEQITPGITKTNNGYIGSQGEQVYNSTVNVDTDRHFDTTGTRVETPQVPNRSRLEQITEHDRIRNTVRAIRSETPS